MQNTRFVWVDLEMTGLDPDCCAIVEMAMIITDGNLTPIAQLERVIWQPPEVLARTVPFVQDMHTKNGLFDKVRVSPYSVADVERAQMLLESPSRTALQKMLKHLHGVLHQVRSQPEHKGVIRWLVDVDPQAI
jgi:oligoribonuclease (3'-5' exoribonuclease)